MTRAPRELGNTGERILPPKAGKASWKQRKKWEKKTGSDRLKGLKKIARLLQDTENLREAGRETKRETERVREKEREG